MAFIRAGTILPSGIHGWYIYYDVNGKIFISSPVYHNSCFHTKEDIIFIRNILNECIERMEVEE